MKDVERLKSKLEAQARRIAQADRDRPTLLAQTVFLGTLGLLFVLPLVIGVYVGHWFDGHQPGYSVRWTMSGLAAGLLVGCINVYLYIRAH
jgi:ATP synthase protein I